MFNTRRKAEIKDEGTRGLLNAVKASSSDIEYSFRKFEVKRRRMAKQQDFIRTQRMHNNPHAGSSGSGVTPDDEKTTLKSISNMETQNARGGGGSEVSEVTSKASSPGKRQKAGGLRGGIRRGTVVQQTPASLLAASLVPVGARLPGSLLTMQKEDFCYHTPSEDLLDLVQGYAPNPNSPYPPNLQDLTAIQRALKGPDAAKTKKKLELKYQTYAELEERLGLTDPNPQDDSSLNHVGGEKSETAVTPDSGSQYYQEVLEILYSTDADHVLELPEPTTKNQLWGSSKKRPKSSMSLLAGPPSSALRAQQQLRQQLQQTQEANNINSTRDELTQSTPRRRSVVTLSGGEEASVSGINVDLFSNDNSTGGAEPAAAAFVTPTTTGLTLRSQVGTAIKKETQRRQSIILLPVDEAYDLSNLNGVLGNSCFRSAGDESNSNVQGGEYSMSRSASTLFGAAGSKRRSTIPDGPARKKTKLTDEELELRRIQKAEDAALLKSLESPPRNGILRWWKRSS